jgi:hypothetical protein
VHWSAAVATNGRVGGEFASPTSVRQSDETPVSPPVRPTGAAGGVLAEDVQHRQHIGAKETERMPTKITLVFDNPAEPALFEAGYPDLLARVKRIPGVVGAESAKVWPKEDGTPTPAFRLLDLYFADYDSASTAVTTQEAGAFFTHASALATGGVRIVFADVEAS